MLMIYDLLQANVMINTKIFLLNFSASGNSIANAKPNINVNASSKNSLLQPIHSSKRRVARKAVK